MFELSDKFFTDLGLDKMTDTFWEKSVLEKPKDRVIVWLVQSRKVQTVTEEIFFHFIILAMPLRMTF